MLNELLNISRKTVEGLAIPQSYLIEKIDIGVEHKTSQVAGSERRVRTKVVHDSERSENPVYSSCWQRITGNVINANALPIIR